MLTNPVFFLTISFLFLQQVSFLALSLQFQAAPFLSFFFLACDSVVLECQQSARRQKISALNTNGLLHHVAAISIKTPLHPSYQRTGLAYSVYGIGTCAVYLPTEFDTHFPTEIQCL